MGKELVFTAHAKLTRERRGIERAWIKRAAEAPEEVGPARGSTLELRKRCIPEAANRELVVVTRPLPRKLLVVTAYWGKAEAPA